MIYDFIYQNPPKATRSASIVEMALPEELQNLKIRESEKAKIIAKTAYEIKYGTDMAKDGYEMVSFSMGSADVYAGDPGTSPDPKGPKPSITSEAFEDIDRPDRYLQGEIDLIDAAYLLFPWDQFKGFMKITIMRYTLRYEHKGWLKDLDKITVYTRRLKELEVKNKEREDRKNEK